MKRFIKEVLSDVPLYHPIRNWIMKKNQRRELINWEKSGKPVPPPHIIKQKALRNYARKYNLKILVETGTYFGDMVEAMKKDFEHIYSIELSKELYKKANKRFKGDKNVELVQGDSGIELKKLVKKIDEPALFWLDGHYSAGVTAKGEKDTPIYEELTHIFDAENKEHVIIIDDARCFGSDPAYPSIDEISDFIKSKRPDVSITIEDDSIRITP